MSDSLERESQIKSISTKLQELFDNARKRCIHNHPQIPRKNIRIRWEFRGVVEFPTSQHENTCPTPNEISAWPEWYLSVLHPFFPDGHIVAEAFVVHSSGEKVPAKDDIDQLSKANLCSYVKERLKDAIETTIGHKMYERTAHVNYFASDPLPPNSFEWVLSPQYRRFPTALSQFDRDDLYNCIEALENGHLRVRRKETAPLDERAWANLERVSTIAKKGVPALIEEAEKSMLKLIEDTTGNKENVIDLPEVMEGTSVILKNWNWKFTEGYAQFYIVIRGAKKRRNRLVDWPAAPLRDLIHAIDMGNLTLIPKSKEDSKSTKRSMKPRRTVTKPPSSHRMFPKSSVDTDASDSEYNDWNSSARIIQDTPESDDEYSQYADSGDTIRVQSPLPNTTHRPKRCNLTSCGRCGNTVIDRSTGDALQDAYCKPSSTQKLLGSWFEKLSSMARDGSEAINLFLVHDAQERVRLQQTIKNQQEQLAQKEKELLGQTTALRSHNNTLHRLSQLISRASSRLDGEGEQDSLEVVDDGQSDGEYVPSQTSKPTIHGQKEESDLETDLQGLICKFESRVDKLNHQNNNNATLNSALLDQQTKLRQQLKDKDVEVKKAEQRGRQEGERLAGTSSHRPEEDQVLRFVTQYPVFNKDGKIRELRIIYKNWNDLPHTLFNEILPKGHDLSEIILHCLAKLSCKVNSAVALSYFRDEITRRSQHQPTNAKSHILTPDDVFKTLQRHGILPSGEGNGNTQKQADRRPLPLQGRLPSTMDVRPEKYTVLPGGGTHQQSRTSQGTTAVKNSQSQMGQAWNRSSNQSPAAPNPPATAARISSFATNSDSQSHKFKDNQPPQKRKDISVVIESNASKRPKPNQNPSPKYAP